MNPRTIIYLFAAAIGLSLLSCKSESATTPDVSVQGLFEFPDELLGDKDDEIPDFLDPETILCQGKGLKVGRCISKQLKNGICLGIIKHHKRVYAVEIPCDDVKRVDSLEVEEEGGLTK